MGFGLAVAIGLGFAYYAHSQSNIHTPSTFQKNELLNDFYDQSTIRESVAYSPQFADINDFPNTSFPTYKKAPQTARKVTSIKLFVWPTATTKVTQGFTGFRHTGLDISNSQKVEVYAASEGVVSFAGWYGAYGNTIIIDHPNGYQTLYAHLSQINVEKGQEVQVRQVIGIQGNTGRVRGATGIHLHFEVLKNGTRLNPWNYLVI